MNNIPDKGFVEELLDEGLITEENLKTALERQMDEGGPLEKNLIELGYITEDSIVKLLLKKTSYSELNLDEIEPDIEAVRQIPYRIAKRYHLIPIRRSKDTLAVAMANPLDLHALSAIKDVTDCKIYPFIAKLTKIEEFIEKYYAPSSEEPEDLESRFPLRDIENRIKDSQHLMSSRFDNFVVDKSNEKVYNLAQRITNFDDPSINFLWIYGGPGTGKSHILKAISNRVRNKDVSKNVLFVSLQDFRARYEEASFMREFISFRQQYIDVDYLLLDDLDTLRGAERAQMELAYIIEKLLEKRKFIVLTSSELPEYFKNFHPILYSKLQSAVKENIAPPTEELKRTIIKKRLENYNLEEDAMDIILAKTGENLREIDGLVAKLIGIYTGEKITQDIVENLL